LLKCVRMCIRLELYITFSENHKPDLFQPIYFITRIKLWWIKAVGPIYKIIYESV